MNVSIENEGSLMSVVMGSFALHLVSGVVTPFTKNLIWKIQAFS